MAKQCEKRYRNRKQKEEFTKCDMCKDRSGCTFGFDATLSTDQYRHSVYAQDAGTVCKRR